MKQVLGKKKKPLLMDSHRNMGNDKREKKQQLKDLVDKTQNWELNVHYWEKNRQVKEVQGEISVIS